MNQLRVIIFSYVGELKRLQVSPHEVAHRVALLGQATEDLQGAREVVRKRHLSTKKDRLN